MNISQVIKNLKEEATRIYAKFSQSPSFYTHGTGNELPRLSLQSAEDFATIVQSFTAFPLNDEEKKAIADTIETSSISISAYLSPLPIGYDYITTSIIITDDIRVNILRVKVNERYQLSLYIVANLAGEVQSINLRLYEPKDRSHTVHFTRTQRLDPKEFKRLSEITKRLIRTPLSNSLSFDDLISNLD